MSETTYVYTERNPVSWEQSRDLWLYVVECIYVWRGDGSPENLVPEPWRERICLSRTEAVMNATPEQRAEIIESRREQAMRSLVRGVGGEGEPVVVEAPPTWLADIIKWEASAAERDA